MRIKILIFLISISSSLLASNIVEVLEDMLHNYPGVFADSKEALIFFEQIDEAKSYGRVQMKLHGDYGVANQWLKGYPEEFLHPRRASFLVSQPIYQGGQTIADIRRAKSTYLSQYAIYQYRLQKLIFDTASAYVDVLRDQKILLAAENNRRRLEENLESVSARFEQGELTITDEAQSRARLYQAIAEERRASGNLLISKQNLARYTTLPIEQLEEFKTELPAYDTLAYFKERVEELNFNIIAQKWEVEAKKADIALRAGQNKPQLTLDGEIYDQSEYSIFSPDTRQYSVRFNLDIPFYQGGRVLSQIEQAKAAYARDRYRLCELVRTVGFEAYDAWESWITTLFQMEAFGLEVSASQIALEAMVEQDLAGERTITDVLDAEQDLFNAQVEWIRAKSQEIVLKMRMLLLTGDLTLDVFEEELNCL